MNATQTQHITLQDVEQALIFIRDHIITDETVETFFGAVNKMSAMFTEVYFGLKSWFDKGEAFENITKLQNETTEVDIDHVIDPLIRAIREGEQDPLLDDIKKSLAIKNVTEHKQSRAMVSFEGVLGAIMFLVKHIKTTGDILEDVHSIVQAVSKIQNFKEQPVDGDDKTNGRSIEQPQFEDNELNALYQEFEGKPAIVQV